MFNQPAGEVARRVLEHGTATEAAGGLGRGPLRQQFPDTGFRRPFRIRAEPEYRAQEPFIKGQFYPAIPGVEAGAGPFRPRSRAVHQFHPFDDIPGLGPEGAGVHGQRAAHRTRYPCHEFGAGETGPGAEPGHLGTGRAATGADGVAWQQFQPVFHSRRRNDGAPDAAVPHQHVTAQANPGDRLIVWQRGEETGQVVFIGRDEKQVCRPADFPGSVPGHVLTRTQPAPQRLLIKECGNALHKHLRRSRCRRR